MVEIDIVWNSSRIINEAIKNSYGSQEQQAEAIEENDGVSQVQQDDSGILKLKEFVDGLETSNELFPGE